MDVEIVVCPIVREDDGLALSSAKARLSTEERKAAIVLRRALASLLHCPKPWAPRVLFY